jgi:hypothetical protein
MNYLGHNPVIRPGGSKALADVTSTENVVVNAQWILIDGFEITNSWQGFHINKPHVTVRNNWVHNNSQSGIYSIASNLYILDNTVESNGFDKNGIKTCTDNGAISPRHCHGMYINNSSSQHVAFITVRGNTVRNHPGNGIMLKSFFDHTGHKQNLVEDNLVENNAQNNIAFYHNITQSEIHNNTVSVTTYPSSDATSHSLVSLNESTVNTYTNNTFSSTLSKELSFQGISTNCDKNTFDYNTWDVAGSQWMWKGALRNDFKTMYKSVTGWDAHGTIK